MFDLGEILLTWSLNLQNAISTSIKLLKLKLIQMPLKFTLNSAGYEKHLKMLSAEVI